MSARLLLPASLAAAAVLGFASPAPAAPSTADSIAADPTVASTAVAAAAPACGLPALPAVYETVRHPAVLQHIAEQSHAEWRWTREVPTTEVSYIQTLQEAITSYEWSRTTTTTMREYARKVVTREFVPAVAEVTELVTTVVSEGVTEYEFRQLQGSAPSRWEPTPDWNAGPGGKGWSPTGGTRVVGRVVEERLVVVQPYVPEVPEESHLDLIWVPDGEVVPAGYSPTGAPVRTTSSTDTVVLPEGQEPAGTGWVRGLATQTAAVTQLVWLPEGAPAPEHSMADGGTRPGQPVTELTPGRTAVAPPGDGWSIVPGSELVVIDVEAATVEVVAAWDEVRLVTPGVPATAPCAEGPDDGGSVGGEVDEVDGSTGGEVGGQGGAAGGPSGGPSGVLPAVATADAASALPATGADVDPLLLALGGGLVLAGAGLLVRGRRA